MFQRGYLEEREAELVSLDADGVSEAYFPLWGVADTDEYLRRSNQIRVGLAAPEGAEEEAVEGEAAEVSLGDKALTLGAVASPRLRVAWGAWFWLKRVVIVLIVCAAGSLLVTMVMNPALTFVEAADLLLERAVALV